MTSPAGRSVAEVLREASATLRLAEVPSPWVDAVALVAHAWGCSTSEAERRAILRVPLPPDVEATLSDLVGERARRVPLQHLTGTTGFRHLTLQVGPGVFVPRPETESVAGAAIAAAQRVATQGRHPVVMDLCTGSAAIAASVAHEVPEACVVAVEASPEALAWARRNVDAAGVADRLELVLGDACRSDVWGQWAGLCDVVVSNPPYIPDGAVPRDPEVRDHDPELALYGGGADGLRLPLAIVDAAAELCAQGGVVIMEHADCQQDQLLAHLAEDTRWEQVQGHSDDAGRPRWVTAVRSEFGLWQDATADDVPSSGV